jgi:hypothetical protein
LQVSFLGFHCLVEARIGEDCAVCHLSTRWNELAGWRWIVLSWAPITLIGTDAAFIAEFRHHASHDR